jgi:hypothetical protein
MDNILEVSGINKSYDDFSLKDIYQRDVSLDLWELTGQVRQPLYEVF